MTENFGTPVAQQATFRFRDADHADLVFESTGAINVTSTSYDPDFFFVTDTVTMDSAQVNKHDVLWYSVEPLTPEDV